MKKGFIQIYTGPGKGKTTAALGLVLRALGAGLSVYFGQFLKKGEYSEIISLKALSDNLPENQVIETEQYGSGRFITSPVPDKEQELVKIGIEKSIKALTSWKSGEKAYDIVVLDELVTAYSIGLVSKKDIGEIISARNEKTELIMTGRGADCFLTEKADLVTEMKEIKHYFAEGVTARKGIEM